MDMAKIFNRLYFGIKAWYDKNMANNFGALPKHMNKCYFNIYSMLFCILMFQEISVKYEGSPDVQGSENPKLYCGLITCICSYLY